MELFENIETLKEISKSFLEKIDERLELVVEKEKKN